MKSRTASGQQADGHVRRRYRDCGQFLLNARHELLEPGRSYPERIGGNDNIIERIGEFIALRFFDRAGRQLVKARGRASPAN